MVEVKLRGYPKTVIAVYDSIKEMPIDRFNEFQKMLFYQIGVGSSIDDFNKHFSRLIAYVGNGEKESAMQEMKNLYNGYFNAINGISPYSFAFACMIDNVNGTKYEGVSMEDHRDMVAVLAKKGLKYEQVNDTLEEVKKNFIQSLDGTFLSDMAIREMKTYYQKLNDNL
jgi:hypothetical protein